MPEKTKVPAVRFKGFTDDWEQRKAKVIFKTIADKGYPELEVLSASQELGMIKRTDTGINIHHDVRNEIGYKRVMPGQFVIHLRSFQGGFAHSEVEGITSPAYTILDFQEQEKNYDYFWKYIFNSEAFIRRLALITYGIRDGRSISFEDFITLDFNYPSCEEQKRIGKCFQEIDNLITLHQCKLVKLQNIKKSMLEKMFPRNGSSVPEIRFAGFTDAWEQRKLSEVVDVYSGRDYKHLSKGEIPVYGTGGYMLSVNDALSFKDDAIGIGRKGTIDKPYILKAPFWTVDTLFYAIPKANYDLNYVYNIFKNIDWKQKDESTGVPSLSRNAINTTEIRVAKYNEQQIIGTFFKNLDNLITLHQRKYEKLQNLKKACLEKMFV